MEIARLLLLFLHLIGFAALFGGAFTQVKGPKRIVNPAMWHGALTMVVTGLLLVGVREMGDMGVNHIKIGVKAVVMVAAFVLVLLNRKKSDLSAGTFFSIFALTALNAAIAVFV